MQVLPFLLSPQPCDGEVARKDGTFYQNPYCITVVRQWTRRSLDGWPPAAECTVQRLSHMTTSPTCHLWRYSALGCSMYQ